MRDIIANSILALFLATWLAIMATWLFLVCAGIHFFIYARKLDLDGYLKFNPLNAILYPRLLSEEGMQIRRRIFRALRLFIGLIAFGFLQGGIAYIVGLWFKA